MLIAEQLRKGEGTCFEQLPFPFLRQWDRIRVQIGETERLWGREHQRARFSGAFDCPCVAVSVPGEPPVGFVSERNRSGTHRCQRELIRLADGVALKDDVRLPEGW